MSLRGTDVSLSIKCLRGKIARNFKNPIRQPHQKYIVLRISLDTLFENYYLLIEHVNTFNRQTINHTL